MKAALPLAFMPDSDKEATFRKDTGPKGSFVRLREVLTRGHWRWRSIPQRAPNRPGCMDYLSFGGYDEKMAQSEKIGTLAFQISIFRTQWTIKKISLSVIPRISRLNHSPRG